MSIEVRSSPIHGLGVFARRTFRKGEWIGRYLARRTDRDGTYVLAAGQSVTFRYRLVLHGGIASEADVRGRYLDYVAPPAVSAAAQA